MTLEKSHIHAETIVSISPRVQIPNCQGIEPKIHEIWSLSPNSLTIRYLDPLGI